MATAALALALAAPAAALATGASAGGGYAPLNQPAPPLTQPVAAMGAALACSGNPQSGPEPVVLSPATGVTAQQNYSWNYERAFTAQGRAWCAVTMPQRTLGDIQVAAEYLTYAIRTLNARAGRRIAVMGHSQGGMSMRWVLRFYPDTRRMVDDVIGFAGSNHGTTALGALGGCSSGCTPASWQQGARSAFIAALNSRAETFPGVSYTEIYTRRDEVVTPNQDDSGSSSVHGGGGRITNVATQEICPADVYEHLTIGTVDPVAYALAIDALDNDGPAREARVGTAPCSQAVMPGVDPANVDNLLQPLLGAPGLLAVPAPVNLVGVPTPRAEPPLRCYVFAGCPAGSTAATCVRARGAARGTRLGPARLGRTRARQIAILGVRRAVGRPQLDRFCVAGGGLLEAGYPTRRIRLRGRAVLASRAILVLTSSRLLSVRGLAPGASVRTLRRRLRGERRIRLGVNTWYTARGSKATLVFRARRGRLNAVGLASRGLTRGRSAQRRLLGAWKL